MENESPQSCVFRLYALCKIPKFHLISWYGNIAEKHSFCVVLGESAESVPSHKISTPGN